MTLQVGGVNLHVGRYQFFTHFFSPSVPHICRWSDKRKPSAGRILFDYDIKLGHHDTAHLEEGRVST